MNLQLSEYVKNNFKTPSKALDLGCGTGEDIQDLTKLGWICDGVDIKTGTDLNLPYLSTQAPYNLVYSNYVIHKLKSPKTLAATIANNLSSNGRFFLQTFHQKDPYAHNAFSEQELKSILESANLKTEKITVLTINEGAPDFHRHIILQATGKKSR